MVVPYVVPKACTAQYPSIFAPTRSFRFLPHRSSLLAVLLQSSRQATSRTHLSPGYDRQPVCGAYAERSVDDRREECCDQYFSIYYETISSLAKRRGVARVLLKVHMSLVPTRRRSHRNARLGYVVGLEHSPS